MTIEKYDQIIIGGGMAGVCCAGELVLNGHRPLLICETAEVGALFRTTKLGDGNTAFLQHIAWQLGWGGGWWYTLARKLNVPMVLHQGMAFAVTLRGSGKVTKLGLPGSGAAFVQLISETFGAELDGELAAEMTDVVQAALAIPYEELYELNHLPLATWLADNGAGEFVSMLLLTFCGWPSDMTLDMAREHLSAFGGIATLRVMLCSEGLLPVLYPNNRDGLIIPMAKAIEERGGTVSRGKKVDRVIVESGRVTGVAFADGTEVKSDVVAIATGNDRIARLLDPLPPEAVDPLQYSASVRLYDVNAFFLLDRPTVEPGNCAICCFDPATMSMYQAIWPLTGVAPWTTEAGKQIAGLHFAYTAEQIAAMGSDDEILATFLTNIEEFIPGFSERVEHSKVFRSSRSGGMWMSPVTVGPRLPRTVESVQGLWFVGDGSEPCHGIWTEAAASCGVLGAREIAGVK